MGMGSYYRPDRMIPRRTNERSIISAINTRIAIDVASIEIRHVRLDQNGRYSSTIDSKLNKALTLEANIDQTGREMRLDVVQSLLDEGVIAVVPVTTTNNPRLTNSYDINELRVGKITQWYPEHVTIELYNERTGKREELTLPKKVVAIVQNPLYAVMNEPNSTLQRLLRKLTLLDLVDDQSSYGRLDMIIKLPYALKTDARRQQAEERRKEIERQLYDSKYGIAYIDSTEEVTPLNRAVDNNLMKQVEYLTSELYSQLGLTKEVFEGTADEQTMLNYNNRTVEPILSAIVDEMNRKFLTATARSQGQAIKFFRDPFKLVPVNQIAEIADKFTRAQILSANELRDIVGRPPVDSEQADQLINPNLNQSKDAPPPASTEQTSSEDEPTL